MMYVDSAWMQWYYAQHTERCFRLSGESFEKYATSMLSCYHRDFIDPDAMGSHGDGGCDGLAESGTLFYACYGSRAQTKVDEKVSEKIASDFTRALSCWDSFLTWIFITNSSVGPKGTACFTELQREHGAGKVRPINMELWRAPDDLWRNIGKRLSPDDLDYLFPGVPHSQNVELDDLVSLIHSLECEEASTSESFLGIKPVPPTKMDYNDIPSSTRIEFNEGRILAPRIERLFAMQADPDLRDAKARAFNRIYSKAAEADGDAKEIVEQIYIAVGGSDFRLNTKRANAVYALTAYFFDSCDIFEEPPEDYQGGGIIDGFADEGD